MRKMLPFQEVEPVDSKFPTSDFAHEAAAKVAAGRKKKRKKSKIDLDVGKYSMTRGG